VSCDEGIQLNDMCIFAPAALIDAPIHWQSLGGNRARAAYTKGEHTVTAELIFNDHHELVDFISDDRGATPDGKTTSRSTSRSRPHLAEPASLPDLTPTRANTRGAGSDASALRHPGRPGRARRSPGAR
jgi:hypothetical protein